MLRPIVMLGIIGMLVVTVLGLSVHSSGGHGSPFAFLKPIPEIDAEFNHVFRNEFLQRINQVRNKFAVETLNPDHQIQNFLTAFLETDHAPETIELDPVLDSLQNKFPGAQYLAANLVSGISRDEILNQLTSWDELVQPEFQEVSVSIVKSGRRMVAMSVLSRRIPEFTIDRANRGGGRFFNKCPHCQSIHALDLDRKNKTLILSCPDCERAYDVLAADSNGDMRRANSYFTGFQVPGVASLDPEADPKQNVLAIWRQVANRCTYEHDHAEFNESEVWKTSDATWLEKQGDCEDTSILLVDSLISAGFDARVAIGWNGNIGQHAWVVLRIGDEQFIIESTIQDNPVLQDLIPVADAAPFYRPEQLFDRNHLYFQNATPEVVSGDYFTDSSWTKVAWNKK